jgi:hypothetical protein
MEVALQVGLVFQLKWTSGFMIVSKAFSRLPIWAMHPYMQATLDAMKLSSCVGHPSTGVCPSI